jgi:hypothetical protein
MKKLIALFSTIFVMEIVATAAHGQIIVGNYTATSFQSGAPLPSSCSGSSVFTLTTTWVPYYCNGGTYVAFGSGGSSATAASLLNGSTGAQPYQTAASTTAFVYPATDTAMLTLDANRTDTYTADGTIERPYKTLSALTAALPSTGLASIFTSPNSSYSVSSAATLPAIPITIYGNSSTWTFSGGVTVNSLPTIIYDLNTVGVTTYATCSSTIRSERHGGSYSGGNVTLGASCYNHIYGTNLSGNSYTLTVNGTLYGEALTGSMKIKSGGSSALLAMYNPNMTKSSGYNIDMTSGGQLLLSGGLLNTVAGTANIYLPTANSVSTLHAISGLITGTGSGVVCASGTTTYVAFGFNLSSITNCTLVTGYQGPTTFLGTVTSSVYAGVSTNFSCTPGVAAGTGASCVCATNHTCTTNSGDLTLATGTATTTGTEVTVVLYGSAQTYYPNCSAEVHTPTSLGATDYTVETSTGFTRYSFGAPSASTTYTIHYQCGY